MNETIQQKVTPSCVSAPAPRKVYVIGHKNPDTDSICSAIAYADIKRRTEEGILRPSGPDRSARKPSMYWTASRWIRRAMCPMWLPG